MEDLCEQLSGWLDTSTIGASLLGWSGTIVAAPAICVIGRVVARALSGRFSRALLGGNRNAFEGHGIEFGSARMRLDRPVGAE